MYFDPLSIFSSFLIIRQSKMVFFYLEELVTMSADSILFWIHQLYTIYTGYKYMCDANGASHSCDANGASLMVKI